MRRQRRLRPAEGGKMLDPVKPEHDAAARAGDVACVSCGYLSCDCCFSDRIDITWPTNDDHDPVDDINRALDALAEPVPVPTYVYVPPAITSTPGPLPGRYSALAVSVDGVTWAMMGGVQRIDMSMTRDVVDVAWGAMRVGCVETGCTISVQAVRRPDDMGQETILDRAMPTGEFWARFRPDTGAGLEQYEGRAVVESIDQSYGFDDVATLHFSIRFVDEVTRSTQS